MFHVCKTKLRPTQRQIRYFERNIGCCRWVYNHCLQYRIDHYDENKDKPAEQREKPPGAYDLQKLLPGLKKDNPWLVEVDSQALKFAAASVDTAFKHFFRRLKQGGAPGFPRFKSKHRSTPSFTLTQGTQIRYTDNTLLLPKIDPVKLDHSNWSPLVNGRVKRVIISRSPTQHYYASVLFEDDRPEPEIPSVVDIGKLTILDMGLKVLCRVQRQDLERYDIASPRFLRSSLAVLRQQQKTLSRRTPGSERWKKQKLKVAIVHEKIREKRKNYFYQVANELVASADGVVFENLSVRSMMQDKQITGKKRHQINRAFSDQALGEFSRILSYKCAMAGKPCYQVDTLLKPNQTCSACHEINPGITLNDVEWVCEHCSVPHHRSNNCLANLKRMAGELMQS